MKQRLLTLALLAGCAVLGGIGFLLYTGEDRKAPKITVDDTELTYQEGDEKEELLAGVSAQDNRDGDLTDQVFVDKIMETEGGKAIVYYGVVDKAGNVGTGRRTVTYVSSTADTDASDAVDEKKEETDASDEEESEDAKAEQETDADEEDADAEEELKPDGVKPALRLTQTSAAIQAGESFNPLSVVENAVDDKDSRDQLYKRIHADGDYNVRKKGTYTIRYYVTDSDGNASEVQEFVLTVQ